MGNLEDYNTKIEVINIITDDQIKKPTSIPVEIYIQEAEKLVVWCQDDREDLSAKGLEWTVVEDLPIRCGALREAESRWCRERFSREEAEKLWFQESPLAYDLRNEIAHHFYYAFRSDASLVGRVNAIMEGNSHDDMIQDLNDLSVLGKANQELLTAIGFDLTLLDLAAQKSDELATVYATASRDREDYSEVKRIRDQAYTHLKEAVDMIRKCGQYVFWKNEARYKGYRSNYLRKLRKKNEAQQEEPEPEPGTEPGSDSQPVPVTTPA